MAVICYAIKVGGMGKKKTVFSSKKYKSQTKDYEELQIQYNKIYESYKRAHLDLNIFKEKV